MVKSSEVPSFALYKQLGIVLNLFLLFSDFDFRNWFTFSCKHCYYHSPSSDKSGEKIKDVFCKYDVSSCGNKSLAYRLSRSFPDVTQTLLTSESWCTSA